MRNERAAADSRHARTGKDGAFYSEDGVLQILKGIVSESGK